MIIDTLGSQEASKRNAASAASDNEGQSFDASDGQVSVVITCYNQARFLGEAIESVLHQSLKPCEVTVVDDGSRDHTSEIVQRYPAVRYIRQENQGVAKARNRGLSESAGRYVLFLDGDDRLLPHALSSAVRHAEAHQECAFVYGFCELIDANGNSLPTKTQQCIDDDHYLHLLHDNYIWMPAQVLYRKAVFDQVEPFRKAADHACDYDVYLRITQRFPISCHASVVAQWRQHGNNTSVEYGTMLRSTLSVYRRQRKHACSDERLKQAYRTGLKFWQSRYGVDAANKASVHIDRAWSELRKAMKDLAAVALYAPREIALRISRKLSRPLRRKRRIR